MPALIAKERIWRRLLGPVRKELQVHSPSPRPVLEQMLYAICRRDCPRQLADAAFQRLQTSFSDWNEVRVSAIRELADVLHPLPHAFDRGAQMIGLLQEVFEAHYSFDLDHLRSKPLQQVAKQFSRWRYADSFVTSWTMQYALRAHAIPIDESSRRVVIRLGLVTEDQPSTSVQNTLQRQVRKTDSPVVYEVLSALAHRYCTSQPQCQDCCMRPYCPTAKQLDGAETRLLRRKKPR